MRWDELDLATALWTIPKERMKAKREHRVPLSPRSIAVLEERWAEVLESGEERALAGHVWPGLKLGRPLSDGMLERVLDRMKVKVTVYGFRSTSRDWCGDRTAFPRELAEAALAHVVEDATERAYRSGTALEKRARLMRAWADYCDGRDAKASRRREV